MPRPSTFETASLRLSQFGRESLPRTKNIAPDFDELSKEQTRELAKIFGSRLLTTSEMMIPTMEAKLIQASVSQCQRLRQKIEQDLVQPDSAFPSRIDAFKTWDELVFGLTEETDTFPEEAILRLRTVLNSLEKFVHEKAPFTHGILAHDLLPDIERMREHLAQLEVKYYRNIPDVSRLRTKLWESYQRQLLTSPPQEARKFLRSGLELLKDFTKEQARIFANSFAKLLDNIADAGDEAYYPTDDQLFRLFPGNGVHIQVARNVYPALESIILSHNHAALVLALAENNARKALNALTHGKMKLKGKVRLAMEPPILAVNFVFTNTEDYFKVRRFLDQNDVLPSNDEEGGVSYPSELPFHFPRSTSLHAPITLAIDTDPDDLANTIEHEHNHRAMIENNKTGTRQRQGEDAPLQLRFGPEVAGQPALQRLQRNWRLELRRQADISSTSIRDETQAYLPGIFSDTEDITDTLSSPADSELYQFLADKHYCDEIHAFIAMTSYSHKEKELLKEAFDLDVTSARVSYRMSVSETTKAADRIASVLFENGVPTPGIQALLRASTIQEWRFLARYLWF